MLVNSPDQTLSLRVQAAKYTEGRYYYFFFFEGRRLFWAFSLILSWHIPWIGLELDCLFVQGARSTVGYRYLGTFNTGKLRENYTMSVRVVARVRPLWKSERELDVILRTGSQSSTTTTTTSQDDKKSSQDKGDLAALRDRDTIVRIPTPKNGNEEYSFQFNGVYDASVSQQELFDAEGSYCSRPCSLTGADICSGSHDKAPF